MLTFLFTKTPLLFFIQSFWRDEAFSYLLAKRNFFEIFVLTASDFNPPLYYLILHFWMKFFGSSEIALRSLSLIFFWATIYIVFLFLTKILKIKSFPFTIYYLLITIFNPLLLYYAFEARMYTMLAFFATLSFYAFYKKNFPLYLFSSILGLYTHYFMLFVILAQLSLCLINKKTKNFSQLKTIYFSLLIFLPWLVFVISQKVKFSSPFWISKPGLREIINLLGIIYLGNESFFYHSSTKEPLTIIFLSSLIGIGLLVKGIYLYQQDLKKDKKYLFQILLVWSVGIPLLVSLISFIKPIFFPRYLIFATIGFLILIIFILEQSKKWLRIIFIFLLLLLSIKYQAFQLRNRQKTDFRKIAKEIKFLSKKNDFVYVTEELDFQVAQYYLGEDKVFIYGKSYEKIPNYVGKALISKKKVTNSLPLYPKKAFILKKDGSYVIQAAY